MNAITKTPASKAPAGQPFRVANIGGGVSNGVVSRQWFARPADERFLSLDALHEAVASRRDRSTEKRATTKDLRFKGPENPTSSEELNDLWIETGDGERAMTHWTFGQIAGLAKAPASYLRTLPSPLVADNLNYGLRWNREKEEVKLYYDDTSMLAATGPDYGRIFDAEVVAAVQNIAGNGTSDSRWKIPGRLDWSTMMYDPMALVTPQSTTLYASDRDVFIFLVDDLNPIEIGRMPNGDPDYVFRGFYVSNSEVGRRSFVLAGFYLRGTCENRILWGVEGFQEVTMRHSKYAPDRFIEEIRPALAATNRLTPPRPGTDEHKAWSAVHRAPPGPDRWRFRSSTFDGIADAMADQWGGHAECGRAA